MLSLWLLLVNFWIKYSHSKTYSCGAIDDCQKTFVFTTTSSVNQIFNCNTQTECDGLVIYMGSPAALTINCNTAYHACDGIKVYCGNFDPPGASTASEMTGPDTSCTIYCDGPNGGEACQGSQIKCKGTGVANCDVYGYNTDQIVDFSMECDVPVGSQCLIYCEEGCLDSELLCHTGSACTCDTCAFQPTMNTVYGVTYMPTTYSPTSPTSNPTDAPVTSNPTTSNPTTSVPTTSTPTTSVPTSMPTTIAPTTDTPTTSIPTTSVPTTSVPTSNPTTSIPTTSIPTSGPTTSTPTTGTPTSVPITSNPTTSIPTTNPTTTPTSMPTTSTPTSIPSTSPITSVPTTHKPTENDQKVTESVTESSDLPITTGSNAAANSTDAFMSNLWLYLIIGVTACIMIIVCIAFFLLFKKKKEFIHKQNTLDAGMEMQKVASLSMQMMDAVTNVNSGGIVPLNTNDLDENEDSDILNSAPDNIVTPNGVSGKDDVDEPALLGQGSTTMGISAPNEQQIVNHIISNLPQQNMLNPLPSQPHLNVINTNDLAMSVDLPASKLLLDDIDDDDDDLDIGENELPASNLHINPNDIDNDDALYEPDNIRASTIGGNTNDTDGDNTDDDDDALYINSGGTKGGNR